MIPQILENNELGLSLNYWQGQKKNERVFLAKQIAEQLGYKNISVTLTRLNLAEGIDKVTVTKTKFPAFFDSLTKSKAIGLRTSKVVFLYDSGVKTLVINSKMPNALEIGKAIFGKSFEYKYLHRFKEVRIFEIIEAALTGFVKIVRQYPVEGYRLDGYINDLNIIIECDENDHNHYNKESDKVRTEKINKALKNPVWIRFNPDNPKFNLGEVINRIILIYHDELLDLKFEGYKLPTCQISEAKQLIKQVALLNMIHSNCAN